MATNTALSSTPVTSNVSRRGERNYGEILRKVVVYGLLLLLSGVFLFPLFWMLTTALKPEAQIYLWPPKWFPDPLQWSNFSDAFSNPQLPFGRFILNTLTIEAGVLTGRLISCTLVAYGFARLNAPGKNFIFTILLATLMLPRAAIIIPEYILFTQLGWVNTFLPLIVPAWFGEAYAIFLMRQFFMTIPTELEEAARIDGANIGQILWKIIVPLSIPVLSVIAILTFKDTWNDFLAPLLYLSEPSKYTVAIGLAYFNGQYDVKMNLLMAASLTMMMPIVILFIFAQRSFVEGISLTGLKG
ncbi:MAG: carbohydrate ABC transporter permease [Chloroflexi bacterium]|nr:carbohydrate ABC transporter permease [Chloroflexota bacterium]MCC6891647.1 carbohydrate ABC transporter permease [Anaerolineae bacterium]